MNDGKEEKCPVTQEMNDGTEEIYSVNQEVDIGTEEMRFVTREKWSETGFKNNRKYYIYIGNNSTLYCEPGILNNTYIRKIEITAKIADFN